MQQSAPNPPRLASRILHLMLKSDLYEEVSGDLYEQFLHTLENQDSKKAKLNYWYQVLNYVRPFALKKTKSKHSNHTIMLRSYLLIAIRNLTKHRFHNSLNILSLAIGFAACLAIYLFIQDEKSFDQHAQKNHIYRLCEVQSFPGTKVQNVALSMPGMGPAFITDFPEVEKYMRIWGRGKRIWRKDGIPHPVDQVVSADSTFLEMFDFRLIAGDRSTALNEPYSILLTEQVAQSIFGQVDVIGETLEMDNDLYKVTGILADIPENSHLQFKVVISITSITSEDPEFNNKWGGNFLVTYLQLTPDADLANMAERYPAYLDKNSGREDINDYYKLYLQPLPEVHLASTDTEHDYLNYRKFNGAYLDVFSLVGLFILIIASVNFMNLTVARASTRVKEVGVRKSIGANKVQLFWQFIVESLLMTSCAFVLSLVISWVGLDFLNQVIDRQLAIETVLVNHTVLLSMLGIVILLGVLTGLYPSLYMTKFNPATILRGGEKKEGKSILRSTLIIIQFSLAIAMIVATLAVLDQLNFMKNKDIGFNKSHILLVDMDKTANDKYDLLKQKLLENNNVLGVTASGQRLGNNFHQWGAKVESDSGIVTFTPSNVNVHFDYLDVYEIDLIAGRNFDEARKTDHGLAFIINEACAKEMGATDPVGMQMGHSWYPDDSLGHVIGLTKDFNFNSLHHRVNTLALVIHTDWGYDEMSIKLNGNNIQSGLNHLEQVWQETIPEYPLEYAFLEDHINDLYKTDQQMSAVISIIAFLSIFIGGMGLFGLSALTTERRMKEIGVRKVLGASISELFLTLSKHFATLIVISFTISAPITYILLSQWLENFAFRSTLSIGLFGMAGVVSLLIALITISYHIIKAARTNPVESLRYE
ncbi:putative ABC transport system permease protein [Reichenbachiella faecimaris]|uniref:Putative ABC transport system permease protein n=1 Tax=Reichenbachiella faecimaris TaxID=692418 RepID=A0A1W2G8G8_REIFA|nr:FtsX-like permease family protein [Reichenbachiella faecimaris]SMD32901.1 putative ABC transport system permease protein [Reichenbachiella faecimaris]